MTKQFYASMCFTALVAACSMTTETGLDADRGAQLYAQECAACHGADAKGGEIGPDLTGLSARNGGVFPRDFVMSTIDGYARGSGHANPMPIFGDGGMGPTVVVETEDGQGTPVPAELLALTTFLETVQEM
ncbi:c-type cytochrome [Shimia ponticola]|uniref:c-type cytochrome n=1 Tax=Shimia ponticola TaxID=2582893 RepID=UPI002107EAD1|nr:cytochrome c [Shimia ponticola]